MSEANGPHRPSDGASDFTVAQIDREIRESIDERRATESVVDRFLYPRYRQAGVEGLRDLIDARSTSPRVACALEELCARAGISPLAVFDQDELLDEAARYLLGRSESKSEAWAFDALWSPHLNPDERFSLIVGLVDRVGDNEHALWMIGDGPIGELQMQDGGVERLESGARHNRRLRRALELVQEIP